MKSRKNGDINHRISMKSEIGTYRPNGRSQMIAPKKLYQKQGLASSHVIV
jgi:hypothetical protein